MSTVKAAFTEEVDGKISRSGRECDNASANTLSLPEICLMSVINFSISVRCLVCHGDQFVLIEDTKLLLCGQ